jgi:hypothetical protein
MKRALMRRRNLRKRVVAIQMVVTAIVVMITAKMDSLEATASLISNLQSQVECNILVYVIHSITGDSNN